MLLGVLPSYVKDTTSYGRDLRHGNVAVDLGALFECSMIMVKQRS